MRVMFMGSPCPAILPLAQLQKMRGDVELLGVISQAPKPQGRGLKSTDTAVAKYAQEQGIPLYRPQIASADNFVEQMNELKVDVIFTAAYGQILSAAFLAIASRAAINLHPSLLPKYRGATPVQSAILDGEQNVGVSICFMTQKLDAGNIIAQKSLNLPPHTHHKQATELLFGAGASLLPEVFTKLKNTTYVGTPQDGENASFCRKIRKEHALIDWQKPASDIYKSFLAYLDWPQIHTFWQGKRLIIREISLSKSAVIEKKAAGSFDCMNDRLLIHTGEGVLELNELQIEGKTSISAKAFINQIKNREECYFDSQHKIDT